jgi:hypothetical protein
MVEINYYPLIKLSKINMEMKVKTALVIKHKIRKYSEKKAGGLMIKAKSFYHATRSEVNLWSHQESYPKVFYQNSQGRCLKPII